MTKLKKKDVIPEGCFNCVHSMSKMTRAFCTLTKKVHEWEYRCKKWEEMK